MFDLDWNPATDTQGICGKIFYMFINSVLPDFSHILFPEMARV